MIVRVRIMVVMVRVVRMSFVALAFRMFVRTFLGVFVRISFVRISLVRISLALIGLAGLRRIDGRVLDDVALDAVAMTAAAGVAVARPATAAVAGAILALFLGLAMGAFIGLDQRLTVGDRDLVVVGMDFAEGQKTVAVAAIFDESRLQRRLYARDFGEVDIPAQLFALGGLEIKFFDAIAADHDDPGLFRVGSIDQHLVGHFGTLDGGGRGAWRAHTARPGDATVHLIRG
jgi:hypothetical protein